MAITTGTRQRCGWINYTASSIENTQSLETQFCNRKQGFQHQVDSKPALNLLKFDRWPNVFRRKQLLTL